MATKPRSKLTPSRGTAEDWAPEREAEQLQRKAAYSKKRVAQNLEAEPDFAQLLKDDLEAPQPAKRKQTRRRRGA